MAVNRQTVVLDIGWWYRAERKPIGNFDALSLGDEGKGGPQWVRFASPQLAPTAPATTVFITLSSVCQFIVLCVCCPIVQWLGTGARFLPPFSTVPGQLSPVGPWDCKHSTRLTPVCLADRRVGPYLYLVRGVHAGQGPSVGGHLLPLAPFGHALPLLFVGRCAYRPGGYRGHAKLSKHSTCMYVVACS